MDMAAVKRCAFEISLKKIIVLTPEWIYGLETIITKRQI